MMVQQQQQDKPKDATSFVDGLSETLQWNRSGIECFQGNDVEGALELFSKAFTKHEEFKSDLFAKMEIFSYGRRLTAPIVSNASQDSIGRDMGDWIIRDLPPMPWRNGLDGDEVTEDIVHCEPIRMPPTIDVIASRMVEAYNSGDKRVEDPALNAMSLLSLCHSYNLGLAHHLCGIKILHNSTSSSSIASSAQSAARTHFNEAGRMFEFTLRMERLRSENYQQQHPTNHLRHQEETNVPRLILVLACLNNLADLYHKCNEPFRCRQCYKKLNKAVQRLQGFLLPGRSHPDDRLLRSYLPVFRAKSRKGLSRWSRSRSNTESTIEGLPSSPDRTPSPSATHYVFSSSTAGAA